jgi:hypothetical protein
LLLCLRNVHNSGVRLAALAMALLTYGSVGAPARASDSDGVPELHVMLTGWPMVLVRDAIVGALDRVEDTGCQRIFTDFRDARGRQLAANLSATGMNAKEFLAALRFVNGDDLNQCDAYPARVAVTQPHSRVIYICASHFAARFPGRRTGSEVIILHEMLHSLGLGENPPTSAEITKMVAQRCDPN